MSNLTLHMNILFRMGEEVVGGAGADLEEAEAGEKEGKQPKWMGVKLFPPPKSNSKAWQFGGFRKGINGQLIKSKTVCGICGKEQGYRGTPTNLYQHLVNKHGAETGLVGATKTTAIETFFKKPSQLSKYKQTHPKQKDLKNKIVRWVIVNKRPLSVVEDEKLVEAFEVADPRLKMPTRWEVTKEIRRLFKVKKAATVEELSRQDYFCCTNDAGSSSGARSFVDMNIHYVNENFEPCTKILSVFEMKEGKTANNYRSRIKEVEREFGVEGKVFSYTTDNEATMKKAFERDQRNGCYAHIESKSCKNVLGKQKGYTSLRVKLRKIAKKAKKSSKFKYAIEQEQRRLGLRGLTLKQEVKTRFTATQTMLRSFCNDANDREGREMDRAKVDANIKAINTAMEKAKFSKAQLSSLRLKSEDVTRMISLVKVDFSSFAHDFSWKI